MTESSAPLVDKEVEGSSTNKTWAQPQGDNDVEAGSCSTSIFGITSDSLDSMNEVGNVVLLGFLQS
jgi:hypothetical protein